MDDKDACLHIRERTNGKFMDTVKEDIQVVGVTKKRCRGQSGQREMEMSDLLPRLLTASAEKNILFFIIMH